MSMRCSNGRVTFGLDMSFVKVVAANSCAYGD